MLCLSCLACLARSSGSFPAPGTVLPVIIGIIHIIVYFLCTLYLCFSYFLLTGSVALSVRMFHLNIAGRIVHPWNVWRLRFWAS